VRPSSQGNGLQDSEVARSEAARSRIRRLASPLERSVVDPVISAVVVAVLNHTEPMPGVEWRADAIPEEPERARAEAAANSDVSIDETAFTAQAVLPTPTATASLVLAPGEAAVLRSEVPRHHGHVIVVSDEEVVLVDGVRRYRCARPGHVRRGGPPLLNRIVSVFVHRRAIGPTSKGHQFVYAIGGDDRLLGTVDASDTWPLREDHLAAMCAIAGVGHEVKIFGTVGDLVAALPEWAAPDLEFEVNHPEQETAREWAWFVTDVFTGLVLFGGAISAFYLTPVGIAFRVAIGITVVAFAALTLWARSRRRMRRSLRRQADKALGPRRDRDRRPT
jgi:hypothetical protein